MEVASGEYGDQMIRLVKAVQKDEQAEPNGDTRLHPLLWQRADEVNDGAATAAREVRQKVQNKAWPCSVP